MSDIIKILLQAEIAKSSVENIKTQLNGIQTSVKPVSVKIDTSNAVKSISTIDGAMTKVNASNTKTWENASGEVIKYTQTLKNLEKGLTIVDTYMKNAKGGFDFTGRTINDKSVEVTYKALQKAHTEAIKFNAALDETARKNHQMAKDAAWKQYFQGISETSHELQQLNKYYTQLADGGMEKAHKQAIRMNSEFDRLDLFKRKMGKDLDIFADKNKGKFDETQLESMKTRLEGLSVAGGGAEKSMKELNMEFGHMKQEASQSNSMLSQITENFVKFARFYLVGQQIVNFRNAVKDGVQSVKELDTSLTELNKITSMSEQQMKLFVDRAYDAGVTIARTGKEVVDATVEWRRAGFAMEEAFELAQKSLLLTNVGSGINDVVEASSSMIAILKGFKMEAEDATHIVDALNEVSNNYAVDTVNLTEILKRVSGTMAQTGTSYEQLIGLGVGAFESLRNSEKVASGKIFCPYVQKCA